MKRHRRPFRVGKRPLEWERFSNSIATGAGVTTPTEVVLSSPVTFEPNVVDSLWTVRSIHLNLVYLYTTVVPVNDDSPLCALGVYKKDLSNPTVADASAPAQEDWVDLWMVSFSPGVGAAAQAPLGNVPWGTKRLIKAMRKLDQNEALFITMTTFHFTVAQGAGFAGHTFFQCSQLWSRSLRK